MADIIIVCGVSGAGKSTLAARLAQALGATCLEGDDYHPPENRAAMVAAIPLDDAMRAVWLDALCRAVRGADRGRAVVVSCSALRRVYRDRLRRDTRTDPVQDRIRFVFLDGPAGVIRARIGARRGHFMPPGLLDSQLATLEPPDPDETDIIRVDVSGTPAAMLERALSGLRGD